MKDAWVVSALSVVPQNRVTRWMGTFARARLPRPLHRMFLRWYIRNYGVDMTESEGGVEDFSTFTEFFTRALRAGLRPVSADSDALVAPCDGRVYACGAVDDGWILQSGSLRYRASELLGGDTRFDRGQYAVIYLSPRDYHRVHTPREGAVERYSYRPGRLWPVFPAATERVESLFAVNERLTSWIRADLGEFALVMVGAFGVGRIRVVYDPVVSNQGLEATDVTLPAPWPLGRAAEIGRFEMGSTVVLVLPEGSVEWTLSAGDPVRLGAPIGRLLRN